MSYEDIVNKLAIVEKEIFNPASDLYLDNLLDLAASISYDIQCSGTWKNSKPIKAFLDRFANYSEKILRLRVSLSDFQTIRTVGQGGFGRVDLVKHKQTKRVYAMKIMDKSTFVQNSFNGFWEERDIMAKNSSDWLIKCYYTFMDLRKLYIVMEYMPGGDLYHWMTELEEFTDEQTHFYAMEMVLAVEILHNMNFLHRDLKPDNMLLDKNGHLKLADFGTCIRVKDGRVKTNFQVGTPDYISPEILRNTGVHDLEVGFEIDWWAFGIVIYELFYGETPFEGESTSTLYQNIMCYKKTLIYPDDKPARPEFIDFISKILTEPNERMGISEIRNHPYLAKSDNYKWNFSNIREHQSPVIFEVSGEDDTQYITFDPNDKRNNVSNTFNNNNYFSGENLAFTGFTFNRYDKYPQIAGTGRGMGSVSGSNDDLESKLSEIELVKQQLSVKLENASNELQKATLKLSSLENELSIKETEISSKKLELSQTTDTNKQLKLKIEALTKQTESTQREIYLLKETIADKETAIKNLKTENGNLSDEVSCLQINLKTNEEKVGKLSTELEEKARLDEHLGILDHQLHQEKSKYQNLEQELCEKNRKISEYENQLELLKSTSVINETRPTSTSGELDQLIKEKQNLEMKLNHLTNDYKRLEEMKNTSQQELSQEKQKKLEVEKIRDRLSKDVSDQKLIVANLQNQLNSLEDQKKVLRQKINVIESEKDLTEQQKKMFESMVNVLRNEKDGLHADLEEAEESFEKERQELVNEKQILQSKHNSLVSECESLRFDNLQKSKELSDMELLKVENDHLFQRFDKVKSELEDSKQNVNWLEKRVQNLENSLADKEKDIKGDKLKIMGLVTKLVEMGEHQKPVSQPRKRKDNVNQETLRKIKQLEQDLEKEKGKFQEKVKELHDARNECQSWQDQVKDLKQDLEIKNNQIKDLRYGLKNLSVQKKSNAGVGGSIGDLSRPDQTDLKSLEGKVDLMKKGKARHKVSWIPSFGVLKPFKIEIFSQDNDSSPLISIDLRLILHIREPSSAECVHVEKSMLPKILHIIYEKQESAEEFSRRQSILSTNVDTSRRNLKSSTLSIDEAGSYSSSGNSISHHRASTFNELLSSSGIYNIENHTFVPMRYRSYTVCDLCQASCSDLINPPPALECSNCKKKIHMEHIQLNDKKIQWCQGAINDLFLKVESKEVKDMWVNYLKELKTHQKINEIQIAPNTYFRSIRQPFRNSPGFNDS